MIKNYGLDFIGGSNYPELINETHKKHRSIGVLLSASGWDESKAWIVVKQASESKVCPIIKVIGKWEDDHRFTESHINKSIQQFQKLKKIAEEFPDQKFWFNPWLEYRASAADIETLTSKLDNSACNIEIVLNPETIKQPFKRGKKFIVELHHKHFEDIPRTRMSFSYDGNDQVDSDLERDLKRAKDVECFWGWDWRFNGKYSEKDNRPRDKRTHWPDRRLQKSIWKQFTETRGKTNLKQAGDGRLYKSHADNHGDGNPRAEKALFLIPERAVRVDLVHRGKVIYSFPYERPFAHNSDLHVYRSDNYGYQIANKVIQETGKDNATVQVWVGDKKIGRINPIFRTGYFRY